MTVKQQNLPGTKSVSHSNLGKEFESEMENVHTYYLQRGIVDVIKNPNAWDYATGKGFFIAQAKFAKGDRTVAKTADGRYLIRVHSDVDFSGGNGKFTICFDAKQTRGNRFPLGNVTDQQIHRLKCSAKCGTVSGAMIKFSELDRVFFVSIAYLAKRFESWVSATYGRRVAKAGTASLSIEDLEANAVEIFQQKINGLWDWFAVIGK